MEQEIIVTPMFCMQFIVWSYYYHNILPTSTCDYRSLCRFFPTDAERLNLIKNAVIDFYTEQSIKKACEQLDKAKEFGEHCPFTQQSLDTIFAEELSS